jgi:hypothetical protein
VRRDDEGEQTFSVAKPHDIKEDLDIDGIIILKRVLDIEGVDWIELGPDKFRWRTFVNKAMIFVLHKSA